MEHDNERGLYNPIPPYSKKRNSIFSISNEGEYSTNGIMNISKLVNIWGSKGGKMLSWIKAGPIKQWLKKEVHQYYIQELKAEEKSYLDIVSNYIEYYEVRAFRCKWGFYGTNLVKLLGLSGITFLKVIGKSGDTFATMAALVTTMCLVIEGIMALFKWQEKWILYRNTQNALMKENRQFTTGQGIYSDQENRFSKFVETVEGIIGDEARKWNTYVKEQNSQKNEEQGKECDANGEGFSKSGK